VNGAESLVRTLLAGGVDTCFTNPGTSEMHFVAALDHVPGVRCVLGLFEGVVSGMADGYGRMTGKPAATLLHCGPGLANAGANLHNARRANTPMVNIVGDHATYHVRYDAPLGADTEGIARPFSHWVRTAVSARSVAADAAAAISAARSGAGQIATLVLPADTAWDEADGPAGALPVPPRRKANAAAIDNAARVLRAGGASAVLFLGGPALREGSLAIAGRIAAATGCKVMAQGANARIERGRGRMPVERVPYVVDVALAATADFKRCVAVGAKAPPAAFFAYPGKPSTLFPPDCDIHTLAQPDEDVEQSLLQLADALGCRTTAWMAPPAPKAEKAGGKLTPDAVAVSVAALMPENAIIADESVTSGRAFFGITHGAPPHDWLQITGGSIGCGLPLAAGAAVACPDRKVIGLQADGSAMYTPQALWTMAREKLDCCIIVFANRKYAILLGELMNVGAKNPGRTALDMLDLGRPDIGWVSLARGLGVDGVRVETMEAFNDVFAAQMRARGPFLIELAL